MRPRSEIEPFVRRFDLAKERGFRLVAGGGGDDFDEMIALRRKLRLEQPVGFETKEELQSQSYIEDGKDPKEPCGEAASKMR